MKKQLKKIHSQKELDSLLSENKEAFLECFIQLNFGVRSSKDIMMNNNGDYHIFNEIDDSEEIIKHDKFMNSFIGEAISKGALYKY